MKFPFKPCAWVLSFALAAWLASPALADKIKHPIAVFSGLDKITGRIVEFEVAIDETAQFGTLQITPRVCFSRPATDAPLTDVFAEVDEVEPNKSLKRIFGGWMFADSPGLHGIEHPVYDIWLVNCKGDGPLIHEEPVVADVPDDSADVDPNAPKLPTPGPAPTDTAVQPRKPRKPKLDASAVAPPPLDLAPQNQASGGRSGPARRSNQVDSAPIPPANVGQ
jgi:hypothetical protein